MNSRFSRREIVKMMSLAVPAAMTGLRTDRVKPSGEILVYGLFFDEGDVARIRSLYFDEPMFEGVRKDLESIDFAAEQESFQTVRYNDQLGQILRLSQLTERMAFLYLMTGDQRAADLSINAIREIMKFDRWDIYMDGPDSIGVQRSPEATLAVVTAADWLGAATTPTERKSWMSSMKDRGCEPCYRALYDMVYPQAAEGWRFDPESTFFVERPKDQHDLNRRAEIVAPTNLRALPASALLVGTIVYEMELGSDDDSERWMEMGIFSVEAFRDYFGTDGSWNEEVHYANFTAAHLVKGVLALVRTGGRNLMDIINWSGYVSFLQNMSMPTSDDPFAVVNFGDSGNRGGSPHTYERADLPVWIAGQLGSAEAQWFATTHAGTFTHWSIISYDPLLETKAPHDAPHLWINEFDRVVARDGWGADNLVVAMRSGPPANHEHADRNSIIVKALGQKLITDPLRPPYGYAHPAWPLRLTQGHSAVLVDGKGHEHHNGVEGTNASRSYARVTTSQLTRAYAEWTSVATQPYRLVDLHIKDVIRSVVVLFESNVVIVVDRMSRYEGESTLTARFFGDNGDGKHEQEIRSDGFVRRRPGVVMHANSFSNVDFKVRNGVPFIPVELAAPHPFVDVETVASEDVMLVTTMSIADTDANIISVPMIRTEQGFDVEIASVQVRITADKVLVG